MASQNDWAAASLLDLERITRGLPPLAAVDHSRTTIDGLADVSALSDEDAAELPAPTRMFLEASPDWEQRTRGGGWVRKGTDNSEHCYGLYTTSLFDTLQDANEQLLSVSGLSPAML